MGKGAGGRRGRGRGDGGGGGEGGGEDAEIGAAERLTVELARVRARFGVDPALAREPLAEVWTSAAPAMEEDEAELVDAVADCLGAGLPLEAALACWDTGGPLYDAQADGLGEEDDDEQEAEDEEPPRPAALLVRASPRFATRTPMLAEPAQPGKRLPVK